MHGCRYHLKDQGRNQEQNLGNQEATQSDELALEAMWEYGGSTLLGVESLSPTVTRVHRQYQPASRIRVQEEATLYSKLEGCRHC